MSGREASNIDGVYDLIVIGGGSAGLSAVYFGAEMRARVALVEKHRVGGDCTWTGCVPSKTLVKAARVAHHMRSAERYGVPSVKPRVDLESVMAHVHDVIDEIYEEETPEALRAKGIDVYLDQARFTDPHTLACGDTILKGRTFLLATGAHPVIPPIEGLDGVDYLTYESIWDLQVLPQHLIVVGGGPIGSEMSQAFRRLGAEVTLIEAGDRILRRDEPEASRVMGRVFESEGINILYNAKVQKIWQDENGIHVKAGDHELIGDALLVAVGRRPNVEGLGLERAGVEYSARGIQVDDRLRTTQPHIYAAGDSIGSYQFTHYAGWQAVMAARNALLPFASKGIRDWVPWTTFTEPEVAHAGLTEEQARERFGDAVQTVELPMTDVDRARAEVDTEGFVKLVYRGSGKLLGATVVSERAGDLIQEWIYVLDHGLSVRDITTAVHVYPSFARANVKAGGRLLRKQLLEGRTGQIVRGLGQLMLKLMRLWRRV